MVRVVLLTSLAFVFSHAPVRAEERFVVSGQANFIFQWHEPFPSPYEGANSLRAGAEHALSRVLTLHTKTKVANTTDVVFDIESAGGRGISDALGVAGFTNLDVVRNPSLGAKPYIARLFVQQTAGRFTIRAGKFSTADYFDLNAVGSDSHLQFTNWTADNNGAYDYAADTRGYSAGVEVEYRDRDWTVRFGEMLMPTVANGIDLDTDITRARSENVEFEVRRGLMRGRDGVVRLLVYVNHANMGSYAEALDAWRLGVDARPEVDQHRAPGRIKEGVGLNIEQALTETVRAFGRWGWNEGRHESFAYTEVNRAAEFGGDVRGDRWSRGHDRFGVAVMINELSDDHRAYLDAGGLGFLLGDGRLTYGAEKIVEAYYTAHLWRGVSASADVQRVANPGYNEDRGPVLVPGLRLHLEF